MGTPTGDTAPDLFATISGDDDVITACLVGPTVGEREAGIIRQMIETRLAEANGPIRFVVLDFTDVAFINSAGLGACIQVRNAVKAAGADVVLYGMSKDIGAVFKMSGLEKIFRVAKDEKGLEKLLS